jgi:uncharacterized protein (TIGR02594 family)
MTNATHSNESINRDKELSGNSRKGSDAPPEIQQKVIDIIVEEARKLQFDNRDLAYYIAIAKRESGFNPDAANPKSTASGIAQVNDDTGKDFGINDSNRFDARASIKAGLGYFREIKARLTKDYGSTSGIYEPLIYFLYHYGKFIHYNDRVKAKNPKPIGELMNSARYADSKTVLDDAIRIESIFNSAHALKIQLTDVTGKPLSDRKVIIVRKKAKPAVEVETTLPTQTMSPPTIEAAADAKVTSDSQPSENNDGVAPPSLAQPEKDQQQTEGDVQQPPQEWEITAVEVVTDDKGNLPEIQSETQEPFMVLIPRLDYEAYNDAVDRRLIHESGNEHEIALRDETPLPSLTTPEAEKPPAPSTATPRDSQKPVSTGTPQATSKPKEAPLPSTPKANPPITFHDVVRALTQHLSWKTVRETSFAYMKQFYTHPKLPEKPLDMNLVTKKGATRTQTIGSSLTNKQITSKDSKNQVTTAEKTAEKIVLVDGDAPWMNVAIAEQKKNIKEKPDDHLTDPKWKELNAKRKEHESAIAKVEKELAKEQIKAPNKQDSQKISDLNKELAKQGEEREEILGQMEAIEGTMTNPEIVKYHKATTLIQRSGIVGADGSSDDTPWCSSFANWCMSQAGYNGTKDARAISWTNWGEKLDEPKYGAITVVKRGGNAFHVAFFVGIEKGKSQDHIKLLGGNQSNSVCEQAYWTMDKLVGYRWPTTKEKK